MLLSKCQTEFEAVINEQNSEANLPTDPEERAIAKDKERKRKIGNVKFIGELFKAKLLSERIVHECIQNLFQDVIKAKNDKEKAIDREFNSELLSKLLSTIGKLLDNPQAKPYMDTYFGQIVKFATDVAFSARVRFMFQVISSKKTSSNSSYRICLI